MIDTPPVGKILCTGMVVQDKGADATNCGDDLVLIQTKNTRSPASSTISQQEKLTIFHDTTAAPSNNNKLLNRATRDRDQFYYFDSNKGDEGEETIPAVAPATSSSTQESSRELRDQPAAAAASLRDDNNDDWYTAIEGDQKTMTLSNRARLARSNSGLVRRISYTLRKSLSFKEEDAEEEQDAWYVRKTSNTTTATDPTSQHVMQTVFFDYVGPPEDAEEEVQSTCTHEDLSGEDEDDDDF